MSMTVPATPSNIIDLTGQRIDLTNWAGWASWWEGSLDMGSGITTGCLQPVRVINKERVERGQIFRLSMPSVVDTGEKSLTRIANARVAPKNKPASALGAGEFVHRMPNERFEHLVGDLANLEGEHPTDMKGVPARYWGEHIKVIAQTVFGAIIPDLKAEIRMNFCMPFSLYTPENKEIATANLDNLYYCYVNEVYHELDIRVGSVIPEGYAAIRRYGDRNGNNVAIDIGDRTTEIIFAKGYQLSSRDSDGKLYGVRQVIEAIQEEFATTHGKSLEIEDVRVLLKAYTSRVRLPRLKVPRGGVDGYLDSDAQYEIISRKIFPVARALATFTRATLNKEGSEIGSNLDTATIYGGGGYLFYSPLRDGITGDPELENGVLDLYLPPEAEYLNASYMLEAVATQTKIAMDRNINLWERKR
ncbi:MAG: hypothetical protein H0V70_30350 [Ktedonobacteraceae bacterium]|jgi:hypothetical protein|nr:hypothetical protein [Ktedonobacteraceae bacterium]